MLDLVTDARCQGGLENRQVMLHFQGREPSGARWLKFLLFAFILREKSSMLSFGMTPYKSRALKLTHC
jgi:hypothetical protein